jgi:NTE family protein
MTPSIVPRTALVLGAGGLVGQAFHLGVLTALEEVGFDARRAQTLVGTSAGSLVAAGLGAGLSASDLRAELLGEPLSREGQQLRASSAVDFGSAETAALGSGPEAARARSRGPLAPQVLLSSARRPWAVRPMALASSLLPAGRIETDMIARGLRRLHGGGWPERDLRICALRARDGRRVVFGTRSAPETDVGTAVAASCAIPAYFAPVHISGQAYVDGGGHSPSNADVVAPDRPELVVVVSPMTMGRGTVRRPPADTAIRLAVRRYLAQEVRRLRRGGAQVVVLQPGPHDLPVMGLNPMLHSRAEEVVRTACASTRTRLAAQPRLLELLRQE